MGDTRFIITADGQQTRWNNHLGVSKHMAVVRGEPIIHRTIRLLQDRGESDIILLAHNPDYAYGGVQITTPTWESILHHTGIGISAHCWHPEHRTIILFGDVYFTNQAMDTILDRDPGKAVLWFGRSHSLNVGSHWKELFGLSFNPITHVYFYRHIRHVREVRFRLNRGNEGGWLLYRSMQGLNIEGSTPVTTTNFVEIDDETTDFDSPADYDEFITSQVQQAM
jgi:hypothetical protein